MTKTMTEKMMGGVPEKAHTNYPSRFQIGEGVFLNFWETGTIKWCKVDAVRFTEGKVRYDIAVPLKKSLAEGEEQQYTCIENVDSVFVIDEYKESVETAG